MPWNSLGSVTLNSWDWKYFNTPDLPGTEPNRYKIKQTFNQGLIYPSGYFLLGWQCYQGGVYELKKIYFDNQIERLFFSQVETGLQTICATRYGLAKLPKSARIDQSNIPVIELFHWS